ncbi:MAG TPA: L,D-transpeptidase family protein [Methyloceanibacter sp.]|nr:L,D-transpeptidase family protein [Methyloceanibacter sp.]
MGGRPLAARLGATGRVHALAVFAVLAALLAGAGMALAQSRALAAADPLAPAGDETVLPDPAGASADEDVFAPPAASNDEAGVIDPATGLLADPGRDPAEEEEPAATVPRTAPGTAGTAPPAEAPAGAASSLPVDEEKSRGTALPAQGEMERTTAPAGEEVSPAAQEPPPPHPIVAAIRRKLEDPALRNGNASDDLAALEAFYGQRGQQPPLWITPMGFTAKAQGLIAEIQKAGEWGLPQDAFALPPPSDLPATEDAQAIDEIKLSLALLKYARFARGGRVSPSRISKLFDQPSNLLDPKEVLREAAAASDPGAYLVSLHPKQDQFEHLRAALAKAFAAVKAKGGRPEADGDVQRIIVNMERWRWMPRDLGSYYVWNNIPAFTTRVMKNGKSIYVEKAIVGQVKYATPIFSAPMRSIVFNPVWVVPDTIKVEDIQPRLRQTGRGGLPDVSVLHENKLSVSFKGKPIDAETVDWGKANIHAYTFTQPPGPGNVLGVLKFNFPNRHAIYMHDTIQRDLFTETVRTLSHGCIRLNQPDKLAALLLAEDKGWGADKVKAMIAKGNNSAVVLNKPVPVHLTYFTMAVNSIGKMETYADVYGIDTKMAQALFGRSAIPAEAAPPAPKQKQRRTAAGRANDSFLSGLFGN